MKFLFAIFLFFVSVKAFPQNSLSGTITDQTTKEPIIGATLYLPDLRQGTSTDENGFYQLQQLPKGKFLAQVRYVGYSSLTRVIEINGATTVNLELSQSATE